MSDLETRLARARGEACQKGTKKSPCGRNLSSPVTSVPDAFETCPMCGDRYYRCDAHGGFAGAKRSLTAHKGICPKRPR